ncbi:Tetratricopeptide TPR_2 repeat-containing protein [Solidesulfovibrio carbinoliphilus subsp. oakridgensis]|uniref:Tetratricopeptide TPR_2 repeat-containing protein n=1 Tax=Solidesulfovibrio carbinoliphilus subsp. oakridgensis TaxID=694327 RepID=G7Q6N6_9BACT|nr:tetratricopeptide repeat protein [Solidesulfovibrio carbinoliphilus]EHJ47971.1 Tetratricopeptide TPR_2 repeat-containing protein [Solidesulfovibrio carbinoliphilus subsp. oakridgensis]
MLPEILGCYQSQKLEKMGKGAASGREFTQRIDWLALRLDAARILVFPLDDKHLPLPLQKTVTPSEFLGHFLPAPLLFTERLAPAALVLRRLLADVTAEIDQAALPEAERAFFTVILVALAAAGEKDDDAAVLAVLGGAGPGPAQADAQKQAINAFGIHLRKERNFDTAQAYYRSALELAPDDERILFNLARVLFEQGDLAGARGVLEQALALDPEFAEARKFLRYVKRREGAPAGEAFPDITI